MASGQSSPGIDDGPFASPSADSIVPDGGFGWIIVLGCAVQTFIFYGTYPVKPVILVQMFHTAFCLYSFKTFHRFIVTTDPKI
jgi:hypothetical protein